MRILGLTLALLGACTVHRELPRPAQGADGGPGPTADADAAPEADATGGGESGGAGGAMDGRVEDAASDNSAQAGGGGSGGGGADGSAVGLTDGSAGGDRTSDGGGEFSLDKTMVDLGTAFVGRETATVLFLTYRNQASPGVGLIPVSGVPMIAVTGQAFKVSVSSCAAHAGLLDGASCTLSVSFRPTTPGLHRGEVTITGMPGGTVSATLVGAAMLPGQLTVVPSEDFDFGETLVGATSAPRVITISNVTSPPLTDLQLFLGDPMNFAVTDGNCPQTLPGGASCTIAVVFAPTTGGFQATALDVVAGLQTVTLRMRGRGLGPARLLVSLTQWTFDGVVGQTSAAARLVFVNDGELPSGLPVVTLSGANQDQFVITNNACTQPITASCVVDVAFRPTSAGVKTATVTLVANPGGTVTTVLDGKAAP
jgi:hypothetical protein